MRILLAFLMSAHAAPVESLRVVTWNLWHGFGPTAAGFGSLESTAAGRVRADAQTAELRAIDADVTFVQECNPLLTRAPRLAAARGAAWSGQLDAVGVKIFGIGLPWGLDAGLAVLARREWGYRSLGSVALDGTGANPIRSWGSVQVREARFAHFAEVRSRAGTRVLLVDTQLHDGIEFTPGLRARVARMTTELDVAPRTAARLGRRLMRGDLRRRAELTRLLDRARELAIGADVVVAAGDFNAAPDGDASAVMREAGFVDAWETLHPDDPGFTYDADLSDINRALQTRAPVDALLDDLPLTGLQRRELGAMLGAFERRPRRIDYVWVQSRGTIVNLKSARRVGVGSPAEVTSDHAGVAVDLELIRD